MTREALWPFALEVYGRPGVEAVLLELQDAHGQCVPFLLWSLWMAASGRVASPAKIASCAELSRAWQDAAVAPLRTLRRHLKRPAGPKSAEARTRIRAGVKALELDAERMLLQMLEEASPPPGEASADAPESLRLAVRGWGAEAPATLLEQLARLAA